jgi:uncharacterized protein (DUF1800 family)
MPTREAPWNIRRVVHLHRRAGFAATWAEIQRDLADGPATSVDRILGGRSRERVDVEEFERVSESLARGAVERRDADRLRAWWVYRMHFGPDPLAERLTLMWHNHFATSYDKVQDVGAMRQQNEEFRAAAKTPFGRLLRQAVRSPALLVWLDAPVNRRGRPNENLARELMELFTLGIGHFTEADVREAARALTGWTVVGRQFRMDAGQHDDGEKVILGRRGRWTGDDLVGILLEHPATSERLANRLCELFFGEGVASSADRRALAAGLRANELDIGWAVETILRSRLFFASGSLGRTVAGPVEYVVGAARALELFDPPPSTAVLADWLARLGQNLFHPPNVFGWPGGRSWISPRTATLRAAFAVALVEGEEVGRSQPLNPAALARRYQRGDSFEGVLGFHLELLLGRPLTQAWRDRLAVATGRGGAAGVEGLRRAVAAILSSPEAQLI